MASSSNNPNSLDQGTTYTWFLSYIDIKDVKGVRIIFFDWACTDVVITIKEHLKLPDKIMPNTRVYMMMVTLGWKGSPETTTVQDVVKFFERGMKIRASPIRVWGEINSESMVWKINYDSVTLDIDKSLMSMTDEEKDKLIAWAQRYPTYEEALGKIASNSPHKVEAFLQLYKDGKIQYKAK